METIKDTISQVMQQWKKGKKESREDPESWIKRVFSKKDLSHVRLNYFKKGVLGLKVDSSTMLYYLSMQKEDLLANLQKKSKEIKDIRFRIGEIK